MDTSSNDFQKNSVRFLTEEDLLLLYDEEYETQYLAKIFGPFLPTDREKWAREMASIQSTVSVRYRMTGGDVHENVARVMFLVIKGHKLVDGNKRSSILCMVGLYGLNGYDVSIDGEVLYATVKEIAALDSQTTEDEPEIQKLQQSLRQHVRQYDV